MNQNKKDEIYFLCSCIVMGLISMGNLVCWMPFYASLVAPVDILHKNYVFNIVYLLLLFTIMLGSGIICLEKNVHVSVLNMFI